MRLSGMGRRWMAAAASSLMSAAPAPFPYSDTGGTSADYLLYSEHSVPWASCGTRSVHFYFQQRGTYASGGEMQWWLMEVW